jgi:amino acid adenylation domain-containing protein
MSFVDALNLSASHGATIDIPRNTLLHELVERQVQTKPREIAVLSETQCITYESLNRRANALAEHLSDLKIGPGSIVGIYAHRSIEMVIGMLGVLKAGAAYLPLDPSYPRERLEFMATDAQIPIILCNERSLTALLQSAPIIYLNEFVSETSDQPRSSRADTTGFSDGESLCYVIYTSGSTGKPKGVLIPHRGICNRLLWMQETLQLCAGDAVLHKTPIGFDVSVWEIFWPLIAGGTVVLAGTGGEKESRYLVELIRSYQIKVVHFVPAMLRAFLEESGLENLDSLRHVICSGEVLDANLRNRFFEKMSARLHNLYGPTEASIDVTHWEALPLDESTIVPIGRPVFNTSIYIVNNEMQLVPNGEPGEIWVAGRNVAHGYHRRPELTTRNFFLDPFYPETGQMAYRTGDYGRLRPDNAVEFLGRMDDQVKIRGQRIELGEIENVLQEHPDVEKCVVIYFATESGGELGAWILPRKDAGGLPSDLRAHASRRLPEAACPIDYMLLTSLPQTANGKVDRRGLEQKWREQRAERYSRQRSLPPQTSTEKVVMKLWAETLRRQECGIQDEFLQLGGNSIHAAMIQSRINSTFAIDLPLRAIFDCGTIQKLSRFIDASERIAAAVPAAAKPGCMSPNQAGLLFLAQVNPRSAAYNIPLAVRIRGPFELQHLEKALSVIIMRHQALRMSFPWGDDGPIAQVSPPHHISLPVKSLHGPTDEFIGQAVLAILSLAREPFDLCTGPLYRLQWIPSNSTDGILAIVVHHIIFDEWSWTILLRELATLLNSPDEHGSLPVISTEYLGYMRLHDQHLGTNRAADQLRNWLTQLNGYGGRLIFPSEAHRYGGDVSSSSCEAAEVLLSSETAEKLSIVGAQHRCTQFMVLLTGFKILLARICEATDLIIACPFAARQDAGAELLIGFFVNTLLLRTSFAGNPAFPEMLARVRETVLGAYTNQDVPFSRIVAALNPERDAGEIPLLQVIFILRNLPELLLPNGPIEFTTVEIPEIEPKFDLKLDAMSTADGIRLRLVYPSALFKAAEMCKMAHQLLELLMQIAAQPSLRLSEYAIGVTGPGKDAHLR